MIEVKNISLALNKRQILNNVSLTLKEGNIYGLVGNNGSGKTMLMKCMCGFIRPTKGTVESNGKVIGRDVDYLPDAGVIIETPGFIPYYSGFQNLKVLAGIKNKISAKEIREAIREDCHSQHGMEFIEIDRVLQTLPFSQGNDLLDRPPIPKRPYRRRKSEQNS